MMPLSFPPEMVQDLQRFLRDEYFDCQVYDALSSLEEDEKRKKLLHELSRMENEHHLFLKELLGVREGEPSIFALRLRVFLFVLLRRLAGLTFTLKLLELHEHAVVSGYRRWLPHIPEEHRPHWERIIAEEEAHEKGLMNEVDEAVVRYIGFVALGLSDAIIEITGVHAGFLGVMGSTRVAGVAGLIVGFSASISMAVAAYLKAKSESRTHPLPAALVTGFSYLLSVVLLALPYFATPSMLLAFIISTLSAMAMSAGFSFYVSVVQESSFRREALENLLLLMGTAFATYFFGEALGTLFGMKRGVF